METVVWGWTVQEAQVSTENHKEVISFLEVQKHSTASKWMFAVSRNSQFWQWHSCRVAKGTAVLKNWLFFVCSQEQEWTTPKLWLLPVRWKSWPATTWTKLQKWYAQRPTFNSNAHVINGESRADMYLPLDVSLYARRRRVCVCVCLWENQCEEKRHFTFIAQSNQKAATVWKRMWEQGWGAGVPGGSLITFY